MPAYFIVLREGPIEDEEAYLTYVKMNQDNPPKQAIKPLVAYGELVGLEGDPPDGVVMLEFDSVEDARAWYDSDEYQAAVGHRIKSGDWRAFIVDGAMNLPG
jgi:uncharacterized protein (DUF1330 family)